MCLTSYPVPMSDFIEKEDAPCWSLWVLLGAGAIAYRTGRAARTALSGHSQSQVINTLLRKHIGLAVGREYLDVCSVAKLKITFISPFCHTLLQGGKLRQGESVQMRTFPSMWKTLAQWLDGLTRKISKHSVSYFIFKIIYLTGFYLLLFASMSDTRQP